MSMADKIFIDTCRSILRDGISDESMSVRPRWIDGAPAHTIKKLYVHNTYDLTRDPIPMITIRRQNFRGALDEILWIYQRQSNRLSDLSTHIWDSWAMEDGTIGKAYGYQIGQLHKHFSTHQKYPAETMDELHDGFYGRYRIDDGFVWLTQTGGVLWDLKNNQGSRRILTNSFNHADLQEMALAPCAYSMSFNVTPPTEQTDGKMVLNAILLQRSQDMLVANGWNVMQYAALVQMLAAVTNMVPGRFDHMIYDCHVYDRHIDAVKMLIDAYDEAVAKNGDDDSNVIPFPNPKVEINRNVGSFFNFTVDDIKLVDYQAYGASEITGKRPVAI